MSDWSAPLLGRIGTRCAQQRGAQQDRQLAGTDTVGWQRTSRPTAPGRISSESPSMPPSSVLGSLSPSGTSPRASSASGAGVGSSWAGPGRGAMQGCSRPVTRAGYDGSADQLTARRPARRQEGTAQRHRPRGLDRHSRGTARVDAPAQPVICRRHQAGPCPRRLPPNSACEVVADIMVPFPGQNRTPDAPSLFELPRERCHPCGGVSARLRAGAGRRPARWPPSATTPRASGRSTADGS
jgi:hypothetical protein